MILFCLIYFSSVLSFSGKTFFSSKTFFRFFFSIWPEWKRKSEIKIKKIANALFLFFQEEKNVLV